jgi:ATP-dependent DNA ligase
MKFDTLYKTDSKDKIREWNVEVVDLQDHAEIIVTHGAKNGQMQVKVTEIWEGKNIGKKNETTYISQAISEAESKHRKQQDKGYSLTGEKIFIPMKAKKFKEHPKKVIYPCYIQRKFDGFRTTLHWYDNFANVVALSYNGKIWKTVDHINKCVYEFLKKNPHLILDGEIFTTEISFNKICSSIKRDEPNEESLKAEFHCYDIFDKNNQDLPYSERMKLIPDLPKPFIKVDSYFCASEDEVLKKHKEFVQSKYEGSIIRNLRGKYDSGAKSSNMFKLKDFEDGEYKIIGKKLDKNDECVFICLDEKINEEFDCKPEGTHEERVAYYEEDNIGLMLTIRYPELTERGVPRFPVGVGIRPEGDL